MTSLHGRPLCLIGSIHDTLRACTMSSKLKYVVSVVSVSIMASGMLHFHRECVGFDATRVILWKRPVTARAMGAY